MTSLKARLCKLATIIAEQAARDPEFEKKIEEIMGGGIPKPRSMTRKPGVRKGGRRAPAVIDPVAVALLGSEDLHRALNPLALDQLLDIVAEYGMDPGKLVMKWKDRERVIDRIVEVSVLRATKGDAFRSE